MQHQQPSAALLAFSGMVALAVAMGIGRFAFTPLLPMMQQDAGLPLAQAGWLAAANYLGYLVGAVAAGAIPLRAAAQLRLGLICVVVTTALMAIGQSWVAWATWRFLAGLASAVVLVSTASLCMGRLAALGQTSKAGIVFAGVGGGIALAGLLCMGLGLAQISSSTAWLITGLMALAGAVSARGLWTALPPAIEGVPKPEPAPPSPPETAVQLLKRQWRLIACYGSFGFGYILPATFLPAQARQLVSDPAIFGLAWPVFGMAAALSTLITSRLLQTCSRRRIWVGAQLIMATGVLLPALWVSIASIVIAALCVGGTFMVVTMVGMQEAQARGGVHARALIAAITAAFALGQLVGPIFFSVVHDWLGVSLELALELASAVLVLGAVFLLRPLPAT